MIRRAQVSTRTATLFPYRTLFRSHPLVSDEQSHGDRVQPQYLRPFLRHDMDEVIEALRLDRSQHRRMDRGDRARMAAREGDEVLVGLFRRRDPRLDRKSTRLNSSH